MRLAIGISTLNNGITHLYEKIKNIPDDIYIIICHQITNGENYINSMPPKKNIHLIEKIEKGLAKSRNTIITDAIEKNIDYLMLSDDDVFYKIENLKKIINSLSENDNHHYQFKSIDHKNNDRKNYKKNTFTLKTKDFFRVSSIEMCININKIKEQNIRFDENYGLGSKYPAGEEAIFLADSNKKGIKTIFLPIVITIHPIESSGLDIYTNKDSLQIRGNIIRRVTNSYLGFIFILLFWAKKFILTKKKIKTSRISALKILLQGYFSS